MHELRKDPLLGRWVAVLNESKTPSEYAVPSEKEPETSCILCAGSETRTPKEITAIREDGKWWARVIPNFRPVFQIEGDLGRTGLGMYDKMNAVGANEIIVETPEHTKQPEDIGVDQVTRVLRLYRERVADLERDPRIRHTLIYKDSGRSAWTSFTHPHSEIAATPVIPKQVKEELDGAKQYFVYKERCIFCDMMREELRFADRVISETRDFVAFSPFAPRFPFEFWMLPKRHSCAFQEITEGETEDLGLILCLMLKKMRSILKETPYSYVLHTAPNRVPRRNHWHTLGEDFHWHIEIIPRLLNSGGFEWGSGCYILTTSPEDASKYLREA